MTPGKSTLFSATAFLLSFALAPALESDEGSPSGFWESVETSQGGIGSALELTADGRFRQIVVVLVEFGYRLDGETLFIVDEAGAEQAVQVAFGDGSMDLAAPNGSVIRKTRFRDPSNGTSIILGDWRYDYSSQATAYERYTQDGRMIFRLPMRGQSGTFEIKGTKLRLKGSNGKVVTWPFRRQGDELLIVLKGKEQRFRLVEDGQWYSTQKP